MKTNPPDNTTKQGAPEPTPNKAEAQDEYAFGADPVLAYAWELYETYSSGSQAQKRANANIRQDVIVLIFMTTVLAVANTLPGMGVVFARAAAALTAIADITGWGIFDWIAENSRVGLSILVLVLSASTTALLSFASQFTPLRAWIMYRIGADRIRSEIYLYRMGVGAYKNGEQTAQEKRQTFFERVEATNAEVYKLEIAPPALQVTGKEQTYSLSRPRQIAAWIALPFRFRRPRRFGVVDSLTSAKQPDAGGKLPGRYHPQDDNGFNKLTPEDYLQFRVIPQRDWYVKKVYEDYERIKDWRKIVLAIGVLSAVLAAIQLEPYIVITTAAVVAINTHLQLNLIGNNYGIYQITANRLDSEVTRWKNLSPEEQAKPENLDNFVTNVERIFEEERVIWMQQAGKSQNETEQSLIKGASSREGIPSFDSSTLEHAVTFNTPVTTAAPSTTAQTANKSTTKTQDTPTKIDS